MTFPRSIRCMPMASALPGSLNISKACSAACGFDWSQHAHFISSGASTSCMTLIRHAHVCELSPWDIHRLVKSASLQLGGAGCAPAIVTVHRSASDAKAVDFAIVPLVNETP